MSGVLIRYGGGGGVPLVMIQEMAEDAEVLTIVASEAEQAQVEAWYANYGVNMANCQWLIAPTNTPLTRDYGPWYIFTGEAVQGIADNVYGNPLDDLIPVVLGDSLGIPVYQTSVVIQGGNYMSDGMGVGMSEEMVLEQNPSLTPEQLGAIMHDYLGLDTYHILNHVEITAHVDTWAKLLDPGRILLKYRHPPSPALEEMAEYLGSLMSSYGRPYEVVRIQTSFQTGYTNSLILNHKVLVPLYDDPLDSLALHTWAAAMPGYEIVGVPGGGWGAGNAVHCRTMGITDRYMLRVVHVPLGDRENDSSDYRVAASVHAYSGQPLLAGMPQVLWRVDGGAYSAVSMTPTAGDSFGAWIPEQLDGTQVQYYLRAADASGRDECHPYVGAGNPHSFGVGPDTTAPSIAIDLPTVILPTGWPLAVSAEVRDDRDIAHVSVEYMINGAPAESVLLALRPLSAVWYDGVLGEGSISAGDLVQVRIKAVDASSSHNTSYDPPAGWHSIDVTGTAEACVWNPCGQPSGQIFFERLEAAGFLSVYTEDEPEDFESSDNMFIFLGISPNAYALTLNQVNGIAACVAGGHGVYVEGGDCWAYHPYHDLLGASFGIHGLDDGDPIQNPIDGMAGTFTEAMSYTYVNPSSYIDVIEPIDGGELIFRHDTLGHAVARATDSTRTIGLCFEMSGLAGNNAASSQEILFQEILDYLDGTSIDLWGWLDGGGLVLEWTPCPGAASHWIYGAANVPYFKPGYFPGYGHRQAVLAPGVTTWWTAEGIGAPDSNWTYLVVAVGSNENEMARSNRFGAHDFITTTGP
jgi:agmatine/peptidylarginine deiminase